MLSLYNVRSLQLYFFGVKYPLKQRNVNFHMKIYSSKTVNLDDYLTFVSTSYSLMHEHICTLSVVLRFGNALNFTNRICNCEQYANSSITQTSSNLEKTHYL